MFSKLDVSDRQNWLEDRMIQDSVFINMSQEKWTAKNRKMGGQIKGDGLQIKWPEKIGRWKD